MGHKKILSIWEILVVVWLYNSSPSVCTTGQPGKHEMSHFLARVGACTVILFIHYMVNRQLSKQNIHWPVWHDRITGSGVYPLRLRVFADNYFSSDCRLSPKFPQRAISKGFQYLPELENCFIPSAGFNHIEINS